MRICLIVAIVGALAAGVVNIVQVRTKITALISQRDDYHSQRDHVQSELNNTNRVLVKTQDTLKQTQTDLADAQAARDRAQSEAAAETKRAKDLSDKLAKTSQQLSDTQNDLAAYKATGYTADQVGKLGKDLKVAQNAIEVANEEKAVLTRTVARLNNKLNELIGTTNYVVTLPAGLKGKILVVDPKWDFVVLNIGEDQGVLEDGELLVSRDGKLVAKVVVRSVEKNRCIANIVPGWQLGQVIEGDEVTPAHPAS